MNRGRIASVGATGGHVHRLDDLSDVDIDRIPPDGSVLMFSGGRWRAVTPTELLKALLPD